MKAMEMAGQEIALWANRIVAIVPGRTGKLVRRLLWRRRFRSIGKGSWFQNGCTVAGAKNISIGNNVRVDEGVRLYANDNGRIVIGDNTDVGFGSVLDASEGGIIEIGSNCLIASGVFVRTSNHRFSYLDRPIRNQGHVAGRVIVGDDVWIGAHVMLLPNVTIGRGAVVGAGSVVTRDIPAYAVAAGNPATVVRSRKDVNIDP